MSYTDVHCPDTRLTDALVLKEPRYLDVVFSDAYPIASGAETEDSGNYPGYPSPTSIRKDTYFSEEKHVKITTLV